MLLEAASKVEQLAPQTSKERRGLGKPKGQSLVGEYDEAEGPGAGTTGLGSRQQGSYTRTMDDATHVAGQACSCRCIDFTRIVAKRMMFVDAKSTASAETSQTNGSS